jgi:hypothetical protein
VTQLDLSGNLLVGLPLALTVLSNLIHLRKGGRRNAVFSFSEFAKLILGKIVKNCPHEISYFKIFHTTKLFGIAIYKMCSNAKN